MPYKDKEKIKEYMKRYIQINKEELRIKKRVWKEKNRKRTNDWNRKDYKKNKQSYCNRSRKWFIKDNKLYPEKRTARNYANNHNFRRLYCLLHLLENEYIKADDFHHTDYEANLGFSVCGEHHIIVDKWREENEITDCGI